MAVEVKKTISDKIYISKCDLSESNKSKLILSTETPVFKVEKLADDFNDNYSITGLKVGDKVIIQNHSAQYYSTINGIEYSFVRIGDILAVVEEQER